MRTTTLVPYFLDPPRARSLRRMVRSIVRASVLGALMLLGSALDSSVTGQAVASTAATSAMELTVRANDPLAPVVVVTNRGTTACLAPSTALGVISVTSVRQAGEVITPLLFTPGFDEPLDFVVSSGLRLLQPGDSTELALNVVPVGPTGHALEVVTWSQVTGPVGFLYPVQPRGALEIAATASWTGDPSPESDVALCAPTRLTDSSTSTAPNVESSGWFVLSISVAAVVLVGGLVVLVIVKRKRSAHVVGAIVVLLAAGVTWHGLETRAARAEITADPSLQAALDGCLAVFAAHDPAGILPALQAPGVSVTVLPGVNHEVGAGGSFFVYWNPDDRHIYAGTGGASDPCTALYHELFHALQDARGEQSPFECTTAAGRSGIGVNEVLATRAQNALRAELGLPERSHYGNTPLPSGDCQPRQPTDRFCTDTGCSCRTPGCAESTGEPHLMTLDGLRYDFQGVGEFVAAIDPEGGFEVQVRQQPFQDSEIVATNTAIALDVGGTHVEVRGTSANPVVLVDGDVRVASDQLPNGGSLTIGTGATEAVSIEWPDGSTVIATAFDQAGINLSVRPAPERARRMIGLLGNSDGDPANDVRPRNGDPIVSPSFATLYPGFADSWRVSTTSSLFSYGPGESTDTFTDRSLPTRGTDATDVADPAGAEALCRRFGVTEPASLENCILDFGLTGRAEFAVAAASAQGPSLEIGGSAQVLSATANIYAAGIGALPTGAESGSAPMRVSLSGTEAALVFPAITGQIGAAGSVEHGADGGDSSFQQTDITAFNGLPGVRHGSRTLFLVGVFLPIREGTADVVDLSDSDTEAQLLPTLGELFAIGDGLTLTGAQQRFVVPEGATSMYLGFADASVFQGTPGAYDDNVGSLSVTVALG